MSHGALSAIATDDIVAAPFAVVLLWIHLDIVHPHVLRDVDHLPVAGAHLDQDLHVTHNLLRWQAKRSHSQGHLRVVPSPLGRKAWYLMEMALPILAKGKSMVVVIVVVVVGGLDKRRSLLTTGGVCFPQWMMNDVALVEVVVRM